MKGSPMKEYDLIIIGSGSATNLLDALISRNPKIKIAVIDNLRIQSSSISCRQRTRN